MTLPALSGSEGIGLITVTTSAAGEDWTNTWGFVMGQPTSATITEGDLMPLISLSEHLVDQTDPDGADWVGPSDPISALIAFHREITFANGVVKSIYISDGKKNPGFSTFWTAALGHPTLRSAGGEADLLGVPLSIAWLIKRNPIGLGVKPGRLYLRDAISDVDVRQGTRDGAQWTSAATATSFQTLLDSTVMVSSLFRYLAGAEHADSFCLGIPHYSAGPVGEGDLIGVTPIANLSSSDPVSRQLTKGRRRTPST